MSSATVAGAGDEAIFDDSGCAPERDKWVSCLLPGSGRSQLTRKFVGNHVRNLVESESRFPLRVDGLCNVGRDKKVIELTVQVRVEMSRPLRPDG